jgi:hypothetical protein
MSFFATAAAYQRWQNLRPADAIFPEGYSWAKFMPLLLLMLWRSKKRS